MRFASIFREERPHSSAIGFSTFALLLLSWVIHAGAQTVFRTATDLVTLQVTVVDAKNRYVPDLRPEDFGLFEEGVQQQVSLFAVGTAPLDLMLLVDSSASMSSRLPAVRDAATSFVRALGPHDRASVILFNHHVRVGSALSGERAALEHALHRLSASGGTALHEALYIGLQDLSRAQRSHRASNATSSPRRQAIVVLTDGDDNASHVTFADVLASARGNSVTIYAIIPPESSLSLGFPEAPSTARFDMRSLAEETGGRSFTPYHSDELMGVYAAIAEELKQQYWLAYVPAASGSGFRRVSVRILTRPELFARTRSGYNAGAPRAPAAARRDRP